jgi:hypothetical protein
MALRLALHSHARHYVSDIQHFDAVAGFVAGLIRGFLDRVYALPD